MNGHLNALRDAMPAQNSLTHADLNLAERIRRLANGRSTLDVAQFQFIGLTDIQARYAAAWPLKRDRVQMVALDFIAARLAPDDVLIPGTDGFLVVFSQRAGLIADAAAQRISKGLNDFFIGSDGADDDIRFEARRKSMNVEDLTEAFGDLDVRQAEPPTKARAPCLGFQPVWDVRREALTTYFMTPLDPVTGKRIPDRAADTGPEAMRARAELDANLLRASEDALRALFACGRSVIVGTTIHISSLTSATHLARIFAAASGFDPGLTRYRIVRITGVEPGFPRIYLEDITRSLKSRFPNIAFSLHWNEPDIASMLRLQPAAIGFSLPPGVLGPIAPRADLFARMRQAIEASHHHHVPFFVEGDLTPELAVRIVAEGADTLSSPLVWPALPHLPPAGKWAAARLKHMASASAA